MCFLLVLFFLFSTNFQWHNNHYVNCPLVLSHSACALCVRSPSSNCLYALSFLNMSTVAVCSRFAVPVNELLIQIVENKMKTSTNTKSNRHRNNDSISKRLCTVQLIKDKSFCLFFLFSFFCRIFPAVRGQPSATVRALLKRRHADKLSAEE